MNSFFGIVETVSSRAVELLIGSVWMSLLLVGSVALLLRALPRLNATTRSVLWVAVLLGVLILPVLRMHPALSSARPAGLLHVSAWSSVLIAAVWLLLACVKLLQLVGSAGRLRTVARTAVPAEASPEIRSLLAQSTRKPRLAVSADVSRPSVAGFFRPSILLPAGLLQQLTDDELQHVVLHELEHLRRRDDWTNLLQKASLALFPLHPALLWLDRKLAQERELACDDGVLRVTQARKAYAACLARLAEDSMVRRSLSLALDLLGVRPRSGELTERVHRILRGPVGSMGRVQAGAAAAAVMALIASGALWLQRCPRLVSFSPVTQAVGMLQASTSSTVPPPIAGSKVSATPLLQTRLPAAVQVSMRVPARQPKFLRAGLRAVAKHATAPRLILADSSTASPLAPAMATAAVAQNVTMQDSALQAYSLLAAWQQQMQQRVPARPAVFAVSQGSSPALSHATYAAVPVQGGWLLFQL